MEFLSITVLPPIGPYFQVFNIPVIVVSFIKSICVCVCMCVYVKTSSHLYRVRLYPFVPLSLVKESGFLVCVHVSLGHRAENYVSNSRADICMGNLLPLDRHNFVLCGVQQIYSVSSSPSLYCDYGLFMMGGAAVVVTVYHQRSAEDLSEHFRWILSF